MCDHGSERFPEAALAAFCSHSGASLEACSCYLGALLEYLLGSALSVVVLVLLALLALEPFGRQFGGMFVLFWSTAGVPFGFRSVCGRRCIACFACFGV